MTRESVPTTSARRPIVSWGLAFGSALLTYLVLELVAFRVLLPHLPQSPALELDADELALATYVFEEALLYLRRYFSESAVRVVYIPSPLECYQLASPEVDIQTYEGRRARYPAEAVERHHRLAVRAVQSATERHGLVFLDATPHLRSVSRSELIHGPRDWKHFNRAGYEALARAVLTIL